MQGIPKTVSLAFFSLTLLVAGSGCTMFHPRANDAVAQSLQNTATSVEGERHALEITMSALDNMCNRPGPDLRPQFETYSKSLARLVTAVNKADAAEKAMEVKHAAYFTKWDRNLSQFRYEVVRNASENRLTEVTNHFQAVARRYYEARDVVGPLIGYLADIRTAIESDLTTDGLRSVQPIVRNATDNGAKMKIALANLTNELLDSGARMSSVSPVSSRIERTAATRRPDSGVAEAGAEVR